MYLHESINEQRVIIGSCTNYLAKLANAFLECGNRSTHAGLIRVANEIDAAANAINEAVKEHTNNEYKQAVQSSVNVLHSALAGIKLATGLKNKRVRK